MALTLYNFRYRDPRTGKWVKARYRAELHVIREQYAESSIAGPPETREGTGGTFNPRCPPDEDMDEGTSP